VREWIEAAGQHCEKVHQAEVVRPRDLGQVQADEMRAKLQGGVVWLAMAVMVSARLWLGGAVSTRRDTSLIRRIAALIHACALPGALLLVTDGLPAYRKCFRQAFRTPQRNGKRGRPRLSPWAGLVIGQVVKRYQRRRVVAVVRRLGQGSEQALRRLLRQTQGGGVLNVAYSERLHATFRTRPTPLVRRTRALLRRPLRLHAAMYLVGTVYNFGTVHSSLTQDGIRRTPAMAAGITDHCWSMAELLWYPIPPPPWRPPKRPGRPSKAMQRLVAQWAT
jgi:hypothetical protein